MSSSKDRPGRVHGRVGEACPVCGDTIRSVSYSGYTVAYCPTCQTGGKVLADNTTSTLPQVAERGLGRSRPSLVPIYARRNAHSPASRALRLRPSRAGTR